MTFLLQAYLYNINIHGQLTTVYLIELTSDFVVVTHSFFDT